MTYTFVDSRTLNSNPRVLFFRGQKSTIVILDVVEYEFHDKINPYNYLIKKSYENALFEAESNLYIRFIEVPEYVHLISTNHFVLSKADVGIIHYCYLLRNKAKINDIQILTENKKLIREATKSRIKTINFLEFLSQSGEESFSKDLITNIKKTQKRTENNYLISTIIIIFGIISIFLFANFKREVYDAIILLLGTINIFVAFLITIVLGVSLFYFREKYRLAYGVLEFMIGIYAVLSALPISTVSDEIYSIHSFPRLPFTFDYNNIELSAGFGYKVSAGLYIMVRGQDNISKGLSYNKWSDFIEYPIRILKSKFQRFSLKRQI